MGRKRRKCTVDLKLLIEQTFLVESEVKSPPDSSATPKRARVQTCYQIVENDTAEIVLVTNNDVPESDSKSSSREISSRQADTSTEEIGE